MKQKNQYSTKFTWREWQWVNRDENLFDLDAESLFMFKQFVEEARK